MDLPSSEGGIATVTVISFTGGNRESDNPVAAQLHGQTDNLGEGHLMLDFANVDYVTSLELGTLVSLNKKVRAAGGQLTLYNLNAHVYEVFLVTTLHRIFNISEMNSPGQELPAQSETA